MMVIFNPNNFHAQQKGDFNTDISVNDLLKS